MSKMSEDMWINSLDKFFDKPTRASKSEENQNPVVEFSELPVLFYACRKNFNLKYYKRIKTQ